MIKGYEYLWNDKDGKWVLLKNDVKDNLYDIVNQNDGVFLIVDDNELKNHLCNLMIKNGCKIISELPKFGAVVVEESE